MKHLHRIKNNRFLQVGVILLIVAFVFLYFEQQKKYIQVVMTDTYAATPSKELSGFEQKDGWQGNYSYDEGRAVEGKTSITFSSWYGKENTITLTKEVALAGYRHGYLMVFIKDADQLKNMQSFDLELSGGPDKQSTISLLKGLSVGWNRVTFIVPPWDTLTAIHFHMVSQPNTIAESNLDRMWLEKNSPDIATIFTNTSNTLSIRTIGNRTYLFADPTNPTTYTIAKPSTIRSGQVTIGLIAERSDKVDLSINGTTMHLTGANMQTCMGKQLKKFTGANDYYMYLRAIVKNGNVTYSVSNNDVDYETCGTAPKTNNEGVRLMFKGSYLIDSVQMEYN